MIRIHTICYLYVAYFICFYAAGFLLCSACEFWMRNRRMNWRFTDVKMSWKYRHGINSSSDASWTVNGLCYRQVVDCGERPHSVCICSRFVSRPAEPSRAEPAVSGYTLRHRRNEAILTA